MASLMETSCHNPAVELNEDRCYRALESRDPRFDGQFFVGVLTTGIYCRPVCPARTPRRKNVRFFVCAAAAAESGLRPCLRCRPETAPGTPAWRGTSATVSRALRLIDEGALDNAGVEALASRMGVGPRHLRRLFDSHVGASPGAVAQTRRIHFAKKLLDETDLPMTQVAFGAGFSSIRRFNAAMRSTYGTAPSTLRKNRRSHDHAEGGELELRLAYRPPFDVHRVLGYLGSRAIPGVEEVVGDVYRRSFRLADADGVSVEGVLSVRPGKRGDFLRLRLPGDAAGSLIGSVRRIRRLFDLDAEPACIQEDLGKDRKLAALLRSHAGIRVPGAWDGFELAVRAILGQQVSVARATDLAGQIARAFGKPLVVAEGTVGHLFPEPADLADADIAGLGLMPATRANSIVTLARCVRDGAISLDGPADDPNAAAQLMDIKGIGPWTAEYVAMRALRQPDAFPAGDLGLRRALGRNGKPVSATECARRAERWRPWRAYAAVLLWSSNAALPVREARAIRRSPTRF